MTLNYIKVVLIFSNCYTTPPHPSPNALLFHACLQMISIVFYFLNLLYYLCCFFFFLSSFHGFFFLTRHSCRVWCLYKCRDFSSCPWSDSLSFPWSVFVAMPDKLFIFPNSFPFFAWKTNINQKSPCFTKLILFMQSLVLERHLLSKWGLAGHKASGLVEGKNNWTGVAIFSS